MASKVAGPKMSPSDQKPLQGKTAMVTGGTGDLGKAIARGLAKEGAHVVLACRNKAKAADVAAEIGDSVEAADPPVDLADPASVREFARKWRESGRPLHVLVHNAGANSGSIRVRGNSNTSNADVKPIVQVNYLSEYVLTRELESVLQRSAPSRVVAVSSVTHRFADVSDTDRFFSSGEYADTKLAQVCQMRSLHKRLADKGITAASADPGGVNTGIWDGTKLQEFPFRQIREALLVSPEYGAETAVYAATASIRNDEPSPYFAAGSFVHGAIATSLPEIQGKPNKSLSDRLWHSWCALSSFGGIVGDKVGIAWNGRRPVCPWPQRASTNPQCDDEDLCERLWQASIRVSGYKK